MANPPSQQRLIQRISACLVVHIYRSILCVSIFALISPHASAVSRAEIASSQSAALILDYSTGAPLYARNADEPRYPASLTKMMTLYMAFEAIQQGRLSMDQKLLVSAIAAEQNPTKLGLRPGATILARDAILGLVTKSANDAAVTLAENLAGSETAFARQMTQRARRLGMGATLFRNASGLPNDAQITTARDMALLGQALIRDFPEFYPLFSTRNFNYRGRIHPNHNRLMEVYDGMDGIKTGFIRASGFNLVASAKRDGRRLVGAVLGGSSPDQRDQMMASLLDAGFSGTLPPSDLLENRTAVALPDPPTPRFTPVSTQFPARPMGGATFLPTSSLSGRMLAPPAAKPTPQSALVKMDGAWAIQIGAFTTTVTAHKAATSVRSKLPGGSALVMEGQDAKGARIYRARIVGLTEIQARSACRTLEDGNNACILLPIR